MWPINSKPEVALLLMSRLRTKLNLVAFMLKLNWRYEYYTPHELIIFLSIILNIYNFVVVFESLEGCTQGF